MEVYYMCVLVKDGLFTIASYIPEMVEKVVQMGEPGKMLDDINGIPCIPPFIIWLTDCEDKYVRCMDVVKVSSKTHVETGEILAEDDPKWRYVELPKWVG